MTIISGGNPFSTYPNPAPPSVTGQPGTLGGDIANALPGLRAEANSMMLSEGVIRRATGQVVRDPDTFEETPEYAVVYEGKCRFKSAATQAGRSTIPGAISVDQGATLSLPIGEPGAGDVRLDDIWECTANPLDPTKVGKKARITGEHSQTFATAHRYPVEEVL